MIESWRYYEQEILTTFIIGHRYVTVASYKTAFDEVVEAALEHVPDAAKPFVVVSATNCSTQFLIDKELVDVVLGM